MSGPIIEARAVNMTFSARNEPLTALEDFRLEVQAAEVVCIVGASGCGKSTFLNIVAGFLRPTGGEVLLEGQPISGVEPRCGMIFQSNAAHDMHFVSGQLRSLADQRRASAHLQDADAHSCR